jgi:hypothetical protein
MASLEERIAATETRLKQLKERHERVRARERAETAARERKADTRRKILVGAVVTAKIERGEFSKATLRQWLNEALTRTDDRSLFGLEEPVAGDREPIAPAPEPTNLVEAKKTRPAAARTRA